MEVGMKARRFFVLFGFAVLCVPALANEANYQQYVVGERAAGMGGAAVAFGLAADAAYYNPAGLGWVDRNSLSLSANLYGFQRYQSDDSIFLDEDFKTSSFVTIPSAMSSVFRLDDRTTLALSAFVPSRYSFSDLIAFPKVNHYYNLSREDQSLWIGPALGHGLSTNLSVGASIYGVYRTLSAMESLTYGDMKIAYSKDLKFWSFGMLAMLGAQYRPDANWRFGLSVQTPTVSVSGSGKYQSTMVTSEHIDNVYMDDLKADSRVPGKISAGLGWEKPRNYAIGLDVSYHFPTSFKMLEGTDYDGQDRAMEMRYEPVLDMNVGAEYYVYENYPVRGGFFTSYSSAPVVTRRTEDFPPQIDLYGLTFSVGRETEHVGMSLGINYLFGSGNDYGWQVGDQAYPVASVVNAREQQVYLFFNTSYMF